MRGWEFSELIGKEWNKEAEYEPPDLKQVDRKILLQQNAYIPEQQRIAIQNMIQWLITLKSIENKGAEHSFMDWSKAIVNEELLEENESL